MTHGRSLELFFVDGQPEGMLTAEVFNWTGHVLRLPRTRLAEGLSRPEARQTGVYILLGAAEEGEMAYIGETENLSERLRQHAKQKDWWDEAVLITTAGDALHKAHVKYLESRLVELAVDAGNRPLENGNAPTRPSLNEAATANMESFLETLQMVLPAIRVDLLQSGKRAPVRAAEDPAPETEEVFEFKVAKHGIHARAVLRDGEMVVLKGSVVRPKWAGDRKYNASSWKLHDNLVNNGIIVVNNGQATLTQDYAFTSPSAAADVVAGRGANGRISWQLPDGRTYAEWEETKLSKVPA